MKVLVIIKVTTHWIQSFTSNWQKRIFPSIMMNENQPRRVIHVLINIISILNQGKSFIYTLVLSPFLIWKMVGRGLMPPIRQEERKWNPFLCSHPSKSTWIHNSNTVTLTLEESVGKSSMQRLELTGTVAMPEDYNFSCPKWVMIIKNEETG